MITVRLVQNKLFTCVRGAAVSNNTVNKAFSFLLCIYMDISAHISYSGAINTATLGILSILANYYFRTCCWLQLFLFIYLFLLEFVIFPGNKAQSSCLTIITRNSVNCWWNLDSGTGDSDSTHLTWEIEFVKFQTPVIFLSRKLCNLSLWHKRQQSELI